MNQKLQAEYVEFVKQIATLKQSLLDEVLGKQHETLGEIILEAADLHAKLLASGYGK